MGKIRITYDRDNCIGAGSCEVVDPDYWKVVDDGKADLKGAKKEGGKWIMELDEKHLEKMKEAAAACPAQVIVVEKL